MTAYTLFRVCLNLRMSLVQADHDSRERTSSPELSPSPRVVRWLVTAWIGFWWFLSFGAFAFAYQDRCICYEEIQGLCAETSPCPPSWLGIIGLLVLAVAVLILTWRALGRASSARGRWMILGLSTIAGPGLLVGSVGGGTPPPKGPGASSNGRSDCGADCVRI